MFFKVLSQYTSNFKEVMRVMQPILVCQVIVLILSVGYGFLSDDKSSGVLILRVLIPLSLVFTSIVLGLICMPAALRTFQKREDGQESSIKESLDVQRKSIGSFLKLAVLFLLFCLWFAVFSIVPGGFLIWLAFYYLVELGYITAMLIAFIGCVVVVYGVYLNYSKVFFPINIYFSKDLGPIDSIKESIRIGEKYRNDVWRAFGIFSALTVFGLIVVMAVAFAIDPQEFANVMSIPHYQPPLWYDLVTGVISLIVSVGLTAPLSYMYMSKAYSELRRKEEEVVEKTVL